MKIEKVEVNRRKKEFVIHTDKGPYSFPYAKLRLQPTGDDRVAEVFVDPELAEEAFTYRLRSGKEDSIHLDAVLDYNQDPEYLTDLLVHRLTLKAREAVEKSGISKRELIRRLNTSASQFYRLIDPGYSGKSLGQLLALLHLVGREVEVKKRESTPV